MSVTRFDSSYAEHSPSPYAEVPGKLPDLRPTEAELRMIATFPNQSDLLRAWLDAGDGTIVMDHPDPDDRHANDSTWYQGRVVEYDGSLKHDFEFRATPPGGVTRAGFRALSVVMGSQFPPRGWLSGRIIPEDEQQSSQKRAA